MKRRCVGAALAAFAVAAFAAGNPALAEGASDYPEATPFAEVSEVAVMAQTMAARTLAVVQRKRLIAIFGADWCHDSRALAGWLQTPRFEALTAAHFVVLYIDVGRPQDGQGRNLALAARFGVREIEGTPNLLAIDPASGRLLNTPDGAKSWRNAASRSEDAIFEEIATYAVPPAASVPLG